MSFSDQIKERIRERVSLTDLLTESGVEVKRSGRSSKALCPFHHEKTPSFSVNEEDGFFHCFGCGKKGDCFTFLMEKRGFAFPEAVRFLANRVGVDLPETYQRQTASASQNRDQRGSLRRVCRVAQELYHAALPNSPARRYLEERGIRDQTIETFRLGYAPGGSSFLLPRTADALKGEVPQLEPCLQQLGLVMPRKDQGAARDFLRDRVIFPIHRSDGAPVAFGGRVLSSGSHAPKYLNTSESPIYQKRKTFYGIHQAYDATRASRLVFIVEGYMDVLALYQAGVRNVLATCGTSLTEEHAQLLRRIVDRVLVLFDGDAAGRKAAASCFERFVNSGIAVEAALLPQGYDPDTYVQQYGETGLRAFIAERRQPLLQVYLDYLVSAAAGPEVSPAADSPLAAAVQTARTADATVRGKVATRVAQVIAATVNPVEREVSISAVADYLGVTAESVQALVLDRLRLTAGQSASHSSKGEMRSQPRRTTESMETYSNAPRDASRSGNRYGRVERDGGVRSGSGYQPSGIDSRGHRENRAFSGGRPSILGQGEKPAERFLRQLLIAVISQPILARDVRAMQSFSVLAASTEDSRRQLDSLEYPLERGGPGVVEEFPEPIRAVLEGLSDGTFQGLCLASELADNDPTLTEERSRIRDLLTAHGLPADELINEATRQLRVGGAKPEKLVLETSMATARSTLKVEVHQLQVEESTASDPQGRLRLAQEKLMKRRTLDRLATDPLGQGSGRPDDE